MQKPDLTPPEAPMGKRHKTEAPVTMSEPEKVVDIAPSKPVKEPTVRRSKFSKLYPLNASITLLATENPKKKGSKSHARFEGYTGAATVADALAAGVTYQDIAYDIGRQFIIVE